MTQQRVLEAIKGSGVKQIAIVDDAFDPPLLDDEDFGFLLDYLERDDSVSIRTEIGVTAPQWNTARTAIMESDYENETLDAVVRALYSKYIDTFDAKYDVGSKFTTAKGANLANVRPIISFLRSCRPDITLTQFGTTVGDVNPDDGELVVFVDLFLDAEIGANEDPTLEQGTRAVEASLRRIEPLMKCNPSVVLMSSHAGRQETLTYRANIQGSRVYASRFVFIEKRKVLQNDDRIDFTHEALDALLGLFESYKFGRGLHAAFEAWTTSAGMALKNMRTEVSTLELRDIAYLVRFRLADEGQNVSEYLEWLFAECLTDTIGKQFDQCDRDRAFSNLNREEAKKIGGAFDGPTETVASLYHRVRIEDKRQVPREHFRLGDLYLQTDDGREVLYAIMNPDCDLVLRPNGKREARSLLMLRGDLEEFTAPKTAVGDFITVKGKPRNINWQYKEVLTLPLSGQGAIGKPGQDQSGYEYIGTLRPLYAQEIQANLLNQLGRVGVAVPPALAFSCFTRMRYRKAGGAIQDVALPGDSYCYFVPARQSGRAAYVVFTHRFVRDFINAVSNIPAESLTDKDAQALAILSDTKVQTKFVTATYAGVTIEGQICQGIAVTTKDKPTGDDVWCWVSVSPRAQLDEQENGAH
ncbi:MAG: hypothetical protein Q8M11_06460 [Sulfuritalea sp.]|nr:hypothetical protein [Sulfuritalea sp.]MDP1982137.1 hypothetical protein [Sulfuritalea sp.]